MGHSVERGLARARILRLRPERRVRPLGPAASVYRAPALARSHELAGALVASRDARIHRLLPPTGAHHAGRHDRRAGRDTASAGAPLSGPAARLGHHGPRGAHDRARVADPAVHRNRQDRARHIGRTVVWPLNTAAVGRASVFQGRRGPALRTQHDWVRPLRGSPIGLATPAAHPHRRSGAELGGGLQEAADAFSQFRANGRADDADIVSNHVGPNRERLKLRA